MGVNRITCNHCHKPGCRLCFLYATDPHYRAMWDGEKPPSILQQAVNLLTATTQHLLAGLPLVDDERYQQRLAICQTCEQYTGNSCRKCGCNLTVKARWAEQKCPLEKW